MCSPTILRFSVETTWSGIPRKKYRTLFFYLKSFAIEFFRWVRRPEKESAIFCECNIKLILFNFGVVFINSSKYLKEAIKTIAKNYSYKNETIMAFLLQWTNRTVCSMGINCSIVNRFFLNKAFLGIRPLSCFLVFVLFLGPKLPHFHLPISLHVRHSHLCYTCNVSKKSYVFMDRC